MNNGRRKTLKALGAACGLTTPAYAATSADAHHVAKLNTGTMPGAAHQLGPQVLSDKAGSQTSLGLAGLPGPLPAAQLPRPHMALNAAAAEWTPTRQPPSGGLSAAAQPWTGGVCSPSGSWSGGVSVGSPRNKNTMTVDTMAGLKDMLQVLCDVQQLAVDCEGVDLSRAGKLCVLILAAQTAGAQTLVWVVDICALEAAAFDTPVLTGKGEITLKQVLESLAVRKLMWDPRQDSNALWHQYKVYLGNVLCLQVAEVAHRQYVKRHPFVTHVWGLGKCFEVYLPRKMPADGSFVDKTVMRQAFRTDSQLWTRRPISDLLIRYCSQDVSHLFLLRSLLTAGLDAEVLKKVEAHSLLRVDECFLVEEPVNNMERAKAMKL